METEEPFEYLGVSILEIADDKIVAFRTDYDPAAFVETRAAGTSQCEAEVADVKKRW